MLIFFLFLHKNICCGYSLEAPRRGASNEYPQHMFSWRNKKNILWIPPFICSYVNLLPKWATNKDFAPMCKQILSCKRNPPWGRKVNAFRLEWLSFKGVICLNTYNNREGQISLHIQWIRLTPRPWCHVLSLLTISWFKFMYDILYSQSLIVGLWHQVLVKYEFYLAGFCLVND